MPPVNWTNILRDQPLPFLPLAAAACGRADPRDAPPPLSRQSRSITRESAGRGRFPTSRAVELGRQFVARDTSPSNARCARSCATRSWTAVAELSAA